MFTVAFKTFGCKLNQAETALMVRDFKDRGYRVIEWNEGADISVLNTCTVTHRSDAKCRQAVRHVLACNPNSTVILTGCYPQTQKDTAASIPGVDYIFGSKEKNHLFEFFHGPGKLEKPKVYVSPVINSETETRTTEGDYSEQTRAFVKIQDGCNNRCAYCIVPFARGPSQSVSLNSILKQTEALVDKAYHEIVLTGVHIGEYGKDLNPPSSLSDLLESLLTIPKPRRIRLSSLEPKNITESLLRIITQSGRICRHFHVPLQSGCDRMLSAMNRSYSTGVYREKIEQIFSIVGEVGLGTDVVVGFPGETDADFQTTYQFIESLPFIYLHVFPFSIREGTKAASMNSQISSRVRFERARLLRELGQKKKLNFMKRWVGREVDVLLEHRNLNGWMSGLTSEYLRVKVPFSERLQNKIVRVKIESVISNEVMGKVMV
jgi:threonylcarbamoyladenosine tRNA methylthiotransferase MtaB